MDNMKIIMDLGEFKEATGGIQVKSPVYAEGNGWKCTINKKNKLKCIYTEEKEDGLYSLQYTLQNGFERLTLKTPYEFKIIKEGKVIRNNKILLQLSFVDNDDICKKNIVVERSMDYTLKKVDPNMIYPIQNVETEGMYITQNLTSDGDIYPNIEELDLPITHSSVSRATWVMIETIINYMGVKGYKRILFTKEDPKNIKNL